MGFSLSSWLLLGVILAAALVLLSHARRLVRARALLQVEVDRQTAEALNSRVAMELQRSELQLLFDLMPAMVWFKDTQNRLLRINRRAAASAGLRPEEMEGRQMEELYPQHTAGSLADDLEMVRSKSPKLGIVEKITDGSGRNIWLHTDKVPYFDQQGNVVGIVVMAQDITERLARDELARLLGSAVEHSKESILVTDADLDEPGPRIVFVNPAFTRMTGYTAAEALGQTPRILQGPKTDRAVIDRLKVLLRQGKAFEGEVINYRKDGSEFLMEWQVAPMRDPAGAITHFVAIQRDISVRRRMETQLLQSQKLETVGKLAGGVAHEFNSILAAIIGHAQLLLEDLGPVSPLSSSVTEIHDAAERAADLTRQLLACGRKQQLRPENLDLGRVLAGLEGTLRHLMGPAIEVRVIANSSLKSIRADPGQVEQVIMNMAMNAADAMPDGGTLILETSNITLDPEYVSRVADMVAGEFVMLAVSDTGIGLTPEIQERIFEPFYTTKDVGEGVGLGLSTCYGIARQSGGHITVYSELGRGTTFKVYFPQVGS